MLSNLGLGQALQLESELSDILVRVPVDGSDICPICRSWRHERFPLCSNCMEMSETLARPCELVIPVSMYRKPSVLRDILSYYKPGRERFDPSLSQLVALIFDIFLHYNLALLKDVTSGFDCVVTVPSTRPEPSDSLQKIVEHKSSFGVPYVNLLGRGVVDLGSRVMSDGGFFVHGDVRGRRILLLDDVYTTGSRAQSAASALALAGAKVVAILVLARRINPEFNEASERVWQRQAKLRYSFPAAMSWLID